MKYLKSIVIILLVSLFSGCNEDDSVAYNLTVDAYIRAMSIDGKVAYSPILIAQSTAKTNSLTATDDNGGKYRLDNYWNNTLAYRWVPKKEDYAASLPESMKFNFIAVSDSEGKETKLEATASLSKVPNSFVIKEMKYDSDKSEFSVVWTNAKASNYIITISKSIDSIPVFQSLNLVASDNDAKLLNATFNKATLKWFSEPKSDENYLLSVHAFNLVSQNDIAGEFIATKAFTWGKSME